MWFLNLCKYVIAQNFAICNLLSLAAGSYQRKVAKTMWYNICWQPTAPKIKLFAPKTLSMIFTIACISILILMIAEIPVTEAYFFLSLSQFVDWMLNWWINIFIDNIVLLWKTEKAFFLISLCLWVVKTCFFLYWNLTKEWWLMKLVVVVTPGLGSLSSMLHDSASPAQLIKQRKYQN